MAKLPLAKLPLSFWFVVCCLLLTALTVGCGDIESAVTSLTVTPSTVTIGVNQGRVFSVVGHGIAGDNIDVSPSWSTTGGIGSINANGYFEAGASTGSGTVVATYGDVSTSSAVTITERCWVEGYLTGSYGNLNEILVSLRGTDYSARTNNSGDFSISNVPAGTYEVDTQKTSYYLAASQEVTLVSGETKSLTIYLEIDPSAPVIPTITPPDLFGL